MVTTTPQHLAISSSSSNFISNVGLIKNKRLDLSFNQVKKHHFVKNLPWCCTALKWRPSACLAEVITATPQHLAISALSCYFISNVGLTRDKVHALNFYQAETLFCCNLFLMLSKLELEAFCLTSRRNHCCTAAPGN